MWSFIHRCQHDTSSPKKWCLLGWIKRVNGIEAVREVAKTVRLRFKDVDQPIKGA